MTNADIKKIYTSYLEDFFPNNFILKGDVLYNKNINNLLVGFCFEKSGFHKESVYILPFIQPLYILDEDLNLTFGKRIETKRNGGVWHLKNNPDIDKTISELKSLMKKELKSFLSKIKTSEDFYDYFKNKKVKNIRIKETLVYSAIHSNNKKSEKILRDFINELKKEDLDVEWINDILHRLLHLQELLGKEEEVNILLNENIKQTKFNLKLK